MPTTESHTFFSALPKPEAAVRWLLEAPLKPPLYLIATHIAQKRPDLFERMQGHSRKRFLIDPIDLPFVLLLVPDTSAPRLTPHLRASAPEHDGAIRGTFLNLLDMIDGTLDGDALFFNRRIKVSGDVEAVVALRNALDDFDGNLVQELLGSFGPLSDVGRAALGIARTFAGPRR